MKVLRADSLVNPRGTLGDSDWLPRPGSDPRGRDGAGTAVLWESGENLLVLLNEYLHNNILELDVQHGRHSLLLGPHERGPKYNGHVGRGHPVVCAVTAHIHQMFNKHLQHFSIFVWELVDDRMDFT